MCRAGKHRELRTWQAGEIARHPAAEQAKQLDRVLGADNIRTPMMSKVGALIARMASTGQSWISLSSCCCLAKSRGKSCGCGAMLVLPFG